jgi:sulfur-carrier protein
MAELHLPTTLLPLFADLPRRLDVEAGTVAEAIDRLDERWPGLRDRLCEPPGAALRPHINVYVDRERAALDTALAAGSRVDVIAAISGG